MHYGSEIYVPAHAVPVSRYVQEIHSLIAQGRLAYDEGEYDAAMGLFQAVLRIDPNHHLAKFFLRRTAYKVQRLKDLRLREAEASVMRGARRVAGPTTRKCTDCEGTGVCVKCKGRGLCHKCGGTGWLELLGSECQECDGTGVCATCQEEKLCGKCAGVGLIRTGEAGKSGRAMA